MTDLTRIREVISEAKILAREYYHLTGRPLGITGEVAEVEAVRVLGLELAEVRQAGYDAVRHLPDSSIQRIQVKGRCCPAGVSAGQRVGSIQLDKEWDTVVLVLLDENLELREIFEAGRPAITAALQKPGSVARNERGALGVSTFKKLGERVWPENAEQLMPQNRESGSAGNTFGHETAQKVAAAIGAEMIGNGSNEARWRDRRVVIKCARAATSSVGVTHAMLDRVDAIIAAFQRTDGTFDVFEMLPSIFRREMRDSRSSGAQGRVSVVTRRAFRNHGKAVRTVAIS